MPRKNAPEPDERITAGVPEFRRISGLSHSSVYRLLNRGDLDSVKIGSKRLIILDSYYRLIERQRAAETAA